MQTVGDIAPGLAARTTGRAGLRLALQQSRNRTLALFAAFEEGLASRGLAVPLSPQLNPPLWELGHVGWFQDWWIARNRERARGTACNPNHPRADSRLPAADTLYDSSNVPHDNRWSLALPSANATRAYLRDSLAETLALLDAADESDDALYFFRLVLLHEDMHGEAAVYMGQALGLPMPMDVAFPSPTENPRAGHFNVLKLPARSWTLGEARSAPGFAFDNERGEQAVALEAFEIDAAPVRWERFLAFIESGGYQQDRWWTPQAWEWLKASQLSAPRYVRQGDNGWERKSFGQWVSVDPRAPATHITLHEAQAWCEWATRRLPTEAQWEYAASSAGFESGGVWEWTASAFQAFPGFEPHPYRDYSAPWFGTRQVLRGASEATDPRIVHPKYRNFFTPERNDIYAGFRTCA